jgi:ketosteroid isomerase-like protein
VWPSAYVNASLPFSRRDWDAVGALLADEIVWCEAGEKDFSGDTRGRAEVVLLLRRLVEVTEGTCQLVPEAFLNAEEYSAVLVRWWAKRQGQRSEGNEIAVYGFRDRKIDAVWFYPMASTQRSSQWCSRSTDAVPPVASPPDR